MTDLPIATPAAFRPFTVLARLCDRFWAGGAADPGPAETCGRRDFVTRLMAEDPTCAGTEYGVTGMMTLFPRDF